MKCWKVNISLCKLDISTKILESSEFILAHKQNIAFQQLLALWSKTSCRDLDRWWYKNFCQVIIVCICNLKWNYVFIFNRSLKSLWVLGPWMYLHLSIQYSLCIIFLGMVEQNKNWCWFVPNLFFMGFLLCPRNDVLQRFSIFNDNFTCRNYFAKDMKYLGFIEEPLATRLLVIFFRYK